jgi:hypothetical protein
MVRFGFAGTIAALAWSVGLRRRGQRRRRPGGGEHQREALQGRPAILRGAKATESDGLHGCFSNFA